MHNRSNIKPTLRSAGFLIGLLTITTLPGGGAALAATYYVSPAGSGSGASASSPRKAQTVLSVVRDGDIVIFLDGSYAALALTSKDVGSGVITLRANSPILTGINGGSPTGLRTSGAVLTGSGGRGLVVKNHNGLVVDGLKFTTSGQGLALDGTSNVTVSRNHFLEHSAMGLVVSGSSTNVLVSQNYFSNQRAASVGAHMDYGLFANNKGTLVVDRNLIVGRFNQGMSLKMYTTSARFTGNTFRCASGSCLMLGQESDKRSSGGSLDDRTVGKVEVLGNKFENIGYVAVYNSNVEDVTISGNSFSNVSRILYNRYDVAGSGATSAGRLPRRVGFAGNTIAKNSYMFLEGRGTIGEAVAISGNQIITPVKDCRTLRMSTASKVSGEQTAGYPTVSINNVGISCPQR